MTTLQGPWDDIPYETKTAVQARVAPSVYDDLFRRRFPLRGFQDRLIASFMQWFYVQCNDLDVPQTYNASNETTAQHIIDQLWKLQVSPIPVLTTHRSSTSCGSLRTE